MNDEISLSATTSGIKMTRVIIATLWNLWGRSPMKSERIKKIRNSI